MTDDDRAEDDLVERLRALGTQPIDPALQSAHLTAMSSPRPEPVRSKLRVAAAFLAGLLVGGSGLAVAGALPAPAQNVAHNVFQQVGVDVPQPERYHDDAECGPEVMANHGGYVRADRSTAQSDCGKPMVGGRGGSAGRTGGPPDDAGPAERGPCQGPPPWVTDRSMSPEAKAAAQADRRASCGGEVEIDEAEGTDEAERSENGDAPPADAAVPLEPTTTTTGSTTTIPPTTTTSAATTTTAAG